MYTEHIDNSFELIKKYIGEHARPTAWISGGKDSMVLMHLLRAWRDRVSFVHARLDDAWPDVTTNLEQVAKSWDIKLHYAEPTVTFPKYVEKYGWPMDMVPSTHEGGQAPFIHPWYKEGPRMASWLHCTAARVITPLLAVTVSIQADLVITGTRGDDAPMFRIMGEKVIARTKKGWDRINPLQLWSDEQVYAYIDQYEISLPQYYEVKRATGKEYEWVDCMSCTWQPTHWVMLKKYYPDQFAKRWPTVSPVYEAAYKAANVFAGSLDRMGMELADIDYEQENEEPSDGVSV